MATTWRKVGVFEVEPRRNRAGEQAVSVDHVRQKVAATAATLPLKRQSGAPAEPPPRRRGSVAASVGAVLGRLPLHHSKHTTASEPGFGRTRSWLLVGLIGLTSLSLVLLGLSTGLDRPSARSTVVPAIITPPPQVSGPRPVPATHEAARPATPRPAREEPRSKDTDQSPAESGQSYQDSMDAAGRLVDGGPWSSFISMPGH